MRTKRIALVLTALIGLNVLLSACNNIDESSSTDSSIVEESAMLVFENRRVELDANATERIEIDAEVKDLNYLILDVSCDVPVIGKLYFTNMNNAEEGFEETFFLPAQTDGEFRQIVDYYQENTYRKKVEAIIFENVGKEHGFVSVRSIKMDEKDIDPLYEAPEVTLESEYIRLTVGMQSGGAIHGLEYFRDPVQQVRDQDGNMLVGINYAQRENVEVVYTDNVNLLNRFDHGRLVQQSYYGISTEPYECTPYMQWMWGYNPVQGGNWTGYSSQIVDYEISKDKIYVKCRPLDWAKGEKLGGFDVTRSYMENTYSVSGTEVKVDNTFTDWSGYDHGVKRDQELPAFYGIISLGTFVTYVGDKPFQNEALYVDPDIGSWMASDTRFKNFNLTENWSAWVNEKYFGVGVYVPDCVGALAGKVGTKVFDGKAEKSEATAYTAMLERMLITTYETFSYRYYLSVGQVNEMRKTFNELAKTESNPDLKKWRQ